MTTPTLTSNMFKNTSHLALSIPHKTAIMKVATGTEIPSLRIKEIVSPERKKKELRKLSSYSKRNIKHVKFIKTYSEL